MTVTIYLDDGSIFALNEPSLAKAQQVAINIVVTGVLIDSGDGNFVAYGPKRIQKVTITA